jgi:hypothetical protein
MTQLRHLDHNFPLQIEDIFSAKLVDAAGAPESWP